MGSNPKVQVFNKSNPVKSKPGLASKIAVVGAFDSTATDPILCTTLDGAYEELGTDTTYKGVSCLDKLFYGASSVLAVNSTTKTESGNETVVDKTLTTAKLSTALSKIAEEDYDMLLVAEEDLTSEVIAIITSFLEKRFLNKLPTGYLAFSDVYASAGDFCYGLLQQQLTVNGTPLSKVDSVAYYCGVLASLNVGNSMTMKVVPDVTGVTPEVSFENGQSGLALLTNGITVFKCQNRGNNKFVVVNSEQPNGLDLYINRTRDFIVKEMNLHDFLGDRNRTPSLDEIKQEIDRVKERCVNTLDLLEDIEYTVEKKNSKCVDINITKLLFAEIITEIDVYISIEVK